MTGEGADHDAQPPKMTSNDASCVQVAVRIRPMLPHEAGNTQCIEVMSSNSKDMNVIRLGGETGPKFTFDEVFPLSTSQSDVYEHKVAPLVTSCLEGYNATILAYGQTGSGKTHTIMGPSSSLTSSVQDEQQAGVIPRAIQSIFDQLEQTNGKETKGEEPVEFEESEPTKSNDFEVRVQFLEVYGEDIRDLLSPQQPARSLVIRDVGMDEPEVVGATEQKVDSAQEALLCLTRGMYRRVTGATAMNQESSRSHALLSLIVEQTKMMADDQENGQGGNELRHVQARRSKFSFVDLAGSERQKRTQAEGHRLREGININQGLLVLGNVISALGDPKKRGKTFVPYRDSKLTRLLKGSLGGNHKTLMIACVSPSSNNMEESLNCLRYANRAKNIQNNAVINLDATSRLVAELRGKMTLLAADLLRAREGRPSDCTIPIEVVEAIANGGTGDDIASPAARTSKRFETSPALTTRASQRAAYGQSRLEEQLHRLRAENEAYRLKVASLSNGKEPSVSAIQEAFVARASEYEREIASLKARFSPAGGHYPSSPLCERGFDKTISHDDRAYMPNLPPRTPSRRTRETRKRERSESPELSRLRAQAFGSMAGSANVEEEVEAEAMAVAALASKFLKRSGDHDDDELQQSQNDDTAEEAADKAANASNSSLEADLFQLSYSISAKEDLIQKLVVSQEKYEVMRDFYEEKLKDMEMLLVQKQLESGKLSNELKKMGKNHAGSKELALKLKEKQEQVAQLKKKQQELARLTAVAARNDSQIEKMRKEVLQMKQKKIDLQKLISSERKSHKIEVQKLKKESMQKDKELNKVKKISDKKAYEAEKAQMVAKSRLEQMNQLKTKYKETEKQLRMKTVKRGVMHKAGLDPVMVGRRQGRHYPGKDESINVDHLRDFLDQKVAEVSRREGLAEKLAQEWEDHFELSAERETLADGDEGISSTSLQSLDSKIKYKEERIRQIASRLGKRPVESTNGSEEKESFLFDSKFTQIAGKNATTALSKETAAKVLFGMVVRERRRIASLARTASALDEKVQEAEAAAAAKDTAFRAYVEEQRLEAASLAQNQQEHILSLMDMVREEPAEPLHPETPKSSGENRRNSVSGNSKLLLLANERIAALEQQLKELHLGHEAAQTHREREEEARAALDTKVKECKDLEEELSELRDALKRIREIVSNPDRATLQSSSDEDDDEEQDETAALSKSVVSIVIAALRQSSAVGSNKPKRNRSSTPSTDETESPIRSIRRQAKLTQSSDSDEVPDWADDIMKDLAIIAEGKIPDSLLLAGDLAPPETPTENQDVFERLTNPDSFTGTMRSKKGKPVAESTTAATTGQRQRKLISRQVADSLNKVVIPGEKNTPPETKPTEKGDGDRSRSVFDRLLSPSNLTGTQKRKYQDKQDRRERSGSFQHGKSSDIDHSSSHRDRHETKFGDDLVEHNTNGENHDSRPPVPAQHGFATRGASTGSISSRMEEYKDLNVFERLNKTTTQAYAVKQNIHNAEKTLDGILDDEAKPKSESTRSGFGRVDGYAQQNVFERLQKTSTRASAGRVNVERSIDGVAEKRMRSSSPATYNRTVQSSPARHRPSKIPSSSTPSQKKTNPSSDVFERLQKTTTEAYSKKMIPPIDHGNNGADTTNADFTTPKARSDKSKTPLSPPRASKKHGDVFQRLQRTTTEAYAKKINPPTTDL